MNYLKKLGIAFGYIFLPIIIGMFILTLFNYFNIISYNVFNIMKTILLCFSIGFGSFSMGRNCLKKGWVLGIKIGSILSIIIIIINYLLLRINFDFKQIFYFVIIFGSSILGSILGINMKKKNS